MYIGHTPSRIAGRATLTSPMPDEPTPAAAAAIELPVLRPASLDALRALDARGGDAFVHRVLNTYLTSLDRHLQTARNARDTGHLGQVRAEAHTLKSSSESIGAVEFARHCALLEQRLRERAEHHPPTSAISEFDLEQALNRFFDLADVVRGAVVAELGRAIP